MMTQEKRPDTQFAQISRFGLVGVLNTIVDFVIYNLLIQFFIVPVVIASVISGTIAMINSFVFNQRFTFRAKKVDARQTLYFFMLTIFGLYVIRSLMVYWLTKTWIAPAKLVYHLTNFLKLPLTQAFVTRNFALVAAIVVVLVYNYITYKKFVFNQ